MEAEGKKEKRYSSVNHLHIPLIILSLSVRSIADELGPREVELTTPVRRDPPVHHHDLAVVETDLLDPAADDLRGVVLERKGDCLGLLLLLLDGLRLLQPLSGASGVTRCVLNADAHDRRLGNSLG